MLRIEISNNRDRWLYDFAAIRQGPPKRSKHQFWFFGIDYLAGPAMQHISHLANAPGNNAHWHQFHDDPGGDQRYIPIEPVHYILMKACLLEPLRSDTAVDLLCQHVRPAIHLAPEHHRGRMSSQIPICVEEGYLNSKNGVLTANEQSRRLVDQVERKAEQRLVHLLNRNDMPAGPPITLDFVLTYGMDYWDGDDNRAEQRLWRLWRNWKTDHIDPDQP